MSPGARAQWAVVPLPLPAAVQDGGRSPALWHLAGVPLLQRAVAALVASQRVDHVLVEAAPELAAAVGVALGKLAGGGRVTIAAPRDVIDVPPELDGDALVVVHDAVHPLASAALVAAVVDALAADDGAAGAVAVRPVTDTLKWVDDRDVIRGTADREAYRVICSPQAYRARALRGLRLPPSADATEALPALVGTAGPLLTVPAPQEVFRVADPSDLELAAALLAGVAQSSR